MNAPLLRDEINRIYEPKQLYKLSHFSALESRSCGKTHSSTLFQSSFLMNNLFRDAFSKGLYPTYQITQLISHEFPITMR